MIRFEISRVSAGNGIVHFKVEALNSADRQIGRVYGDPVGGFVNLDVHPAHQNRGIGTRLLTEYIRLVETETSVPRVRFTVSNINHGAIRLYRRLGFDVHGFGCNYVLECVLLREPTGSFRLLPPLPKDEMEPLKEPPVPSDSLPL